MRVPAPRRLLVVALSFGAVSALVGGVLGVVANGAGLPLEYLQGSGFPSYRLPGVILGVVIGGTQAAGAHAVHRGYRRAAVPASVAGFGMLVWIFAELAILGEYSFLQAVYFALGIGELLLVLVVAGAFDPPRVGTVRRP